MLVKELIEELKKFPEDADIIVKVQNIKDIMLYLLLEL